jgi:hypothetical protein
MLSDYHLRKKVKMPVEEIHDYRDLAPIAEQMSEEFQSYRYTPTPQPNNWSEIMKNQLATGMFVYKML